MQLTNLCVNIALGGLRLHSSICQLLTPRRYLLSLQTNHPSMMESHYMGSSCRGSIRSCDFQSSNNSVASPVSARNALLSASSINALVTDRELFTTAASVVPKLRAVVEHRKECGRSSNAWQMAPADRQYPPCWVVKKKHHGAEISEFDRAKLPSTRSMDGPTWFRGTVRAIDSRHSMIESRGSIYTRDAFMGEHTHSEIQARQLLQWPRNDNSITYAVSAQVTLGCRLDEAMTMLFSRDTMQFDASMASLFGARKYKSADLLVSREFHKNLQTALVMEYGDDSPTCWEDEDLNDLSQPGWVALQSVVLRSRRSLNPMSAAKHTSRRQRLCFAAYSQYCPDTNEAFYTMKTLPKPMHDKFTRRRNERASEQAIRGGMDHIAAGYHVSSSYSDLSGHQTRVVMIAYVSSPPTSTDVPTSASRARPRFWDQVHPGGSIRHYAPPTANAEAKYVVNLLAAATTSFEQLVRRRRLGYQPFLHVPVNREAEQGNRCSVCLKTFGLLRPQRFCQLCAKRVCRECSRKFDVEPIARRVRRNRICFACVANVDASVFQQGNPLLHATFPRVSTAATTGTRNDADDREDEVDTYDTKISTAFYDILLKPSNTTHNSHSTDTATASQTVYEAQMHRLDRSSSAATASASFSSTSGRQLADALFSSDPLTRARALEIVRQVVKQVTSSSAPTSSTSTSSSTSTFNSSVPVFHPQHPDKKMVDKYLEARLHLSNISLSGDPTAAENNIPRRQSSSLYNLEEVTQRRRRSTSGQCFSSVKLDMNSRPSVVPRPWTTTANLETELDLDDDLDSAALDSICEVAAIRMRCSIAYIVALNSSHSSQTQRIVGFSGTPRPWTEEVTVCPFPLVANGKPFVIKDPMRDPQLRHLRLVRDIGVRFFAGFPIKSPDGSVVACLCTVDDKAREKISLEDLKAMHALSKLASDLFEEEVNPFTPRSMLRHCQ